MPHLWFTKKRSEGHETSGLTENPEDEVAVNSRWRNAEKKNKLLCNTRLSTSLLSSAAQAAFLLAIRN